MNKNIIKISNKISTLTYVVLSLFTVLFAIFFFFLRDDTQSLLTRYNESKVFGLLIFGVLFFRICSKKDKSTDIKDITFNKTELQINYLNKTNKTFKINDIKECIFDIKPDSAFTKNTNIDMNSIHLRLLIVTTNNKIFEKFQTIRPGFFNHSYDFIFKINKLPKLYKDKIKINIAGNNDVKNINNKKAFLELIK